jgi:periplasmic divalent cation tolerance protein
MKEYIVVTTLCNKKEVVDKIIENLLDKNLVAGVQVSEVYSKYWWKNNIEEEKEYKIEFRTKKELFSEIEYEIKKVHDYYVAEISSYKIENASKEFLDWIEETTK